MAFLVWNKNNAKHNDNDKNILSSKILNKQNIRDKPIVIISVAGQYLLFCSLACLSKSFCPIFYCVAHFSIA
jgi:hypothetical protein